MLSSELILISIALLSANNNGHLIGKQEPSNTTNVKLQFIQPKISSLISSVYNATFYSSIENIKQIAFEFEAFQLYFIIQLNQTRNNRCQFTGFVNKSQEMHGQFNLCKGIDGVFQWDNKLWFIKPNTKTKFNSKFLKTEMNFLPHKIYFTALNLNKPLFSCKLLKNKGYRNIPQESHFSRVFQRMKRETYPVVDSEIVEPNIIELLIVVTSNFVKRFKKDFRQYILSNVAIATKLLHDPTIKASITIDVVDIVLLDEDYERNNDLHDWSLLSQDRVVSRFCHWVRQKKQLWNYSWDSAILINDGVFSSNAIGIAHLRSMCNDNNCLAVVDRGFGTGFIIAHELAHQMNARHDFDNAEACSFFEKQYDNKTKYNTIMSTSLFFEYYPFIWSVCSQNVINSFLKSKYSFCLKQRNRHRNLYPHEQINEFFQKYSTGVDYDLNEQCSFAFGEKSEFCETDQNSRKKCSVLYCRLKRYPICLRADAIIADGTECDVNQHCINGKCLYKNITIAPIDGGWSEYSEWSNCSRPCNGGVQFSYRTCDNPVPADGGRFCTGTKERIRSCNIEECSSFSDPREESCGKYNLKPYIPTNDEEFPCNLVCITTNHSLKYDISLTDGTPCSPFRSDICVKGTCYKTGCDRIVGSKKAIDNCNICAGQNDTCFKKESFFDGSKVAKVRMIRAFRIPPNVYNLFIKKVSQRMTPFTDEVYDDFELLLVVNRRTVIRRSETIEPLAGGQLRYSGSKNKVETVSIKGKLNVGISIVIKVENTKTTLNLPFISYHYFVKDIFVWKYLEVITHPCKDQCGGFIEISPACFKKRDNQRYVDHYCSKATKPEPKIIKCGAICGYRWQRATEHYINSTVNKSCPIRCGTGKVKIPFVCQKINNQDDNNSLWETVEENLCFAVDLVDRPIEELNCVGQCNPLLWSYGKWEECPIECGTTFRYRNFICKDNKGLEWQKEWCERHLGLPDNKETCLSFNNCRNLTRWVTSPWSRCSNSCESELQKRMVYCFRSEKSDEILDEKFLKIHEQISDAFCDIHSPKPITERPCSLNSCYFWIKSKSGKCSAKCGLGFRIQSHECKKKFNKNHEMITVDDKFCLKQNLVKPLDVRMRCFLKKCAIESFWIEMEWSKCSVSCGEGLQYRSLKCGYENENKTLTTWDNNEMCKNKMVPVSIQICKVTPCPKWIYSEWSECEGTCEYGSQHRTVLCTDPISEQILPDSKCDIKNKFPNFQKCLLSKLCGHWIVGKWSQCSTSCGLGVKTRTITCNYSNGSKSIDHSVCKSVAPFEEIHCQVKPCSTNAFWWLVKPSECYEYNCQPGIMYAHVRCVNRKFQVLYDSKCSRIKHPSYYVGCLNTTCRRYFWTAESWDNIPCPDISCTMKIRNRDVYCVDDYGNIQRDAMCDQSDKPDTWRLCPSPQNCSNIPRSCKELKSRQSVSKDGEYSLAIDLNWAYFIYCADMNTEEPKEYLTLRELNYARTSKYVSTDVSSCIYEEEMEFNQKCPTCKINENLWSITYYNKIRINLTDLSIDVMDDRFSATNGQSFIPFGTAKDCAGSTSCPKGHFKINLRGTGFSVSMETRWNEVYPKYGYRILRKQTSQIVKGWCGGHCSGCSPLKKFFVEPQMYGRDFEIKSREVL